MLDVADAVVAVIDPISDLPVVSPIGSELVGNEGVVVSTAGVELLEEYYDGSSTQSYSVDIVSMSEQSDIVEGLSWAFREALDGTPLHSPTNSYRWAATEVSMEPKEIDKDGASVCWKLQIRVRVEKSN